MNRPAEPIAEELLASCLTAARHHLIRRGMDQGSAPTVAMAGASWALFMALLAKPDLEDGDVAEAVVEGFADTLGLVLSQTPREDWGPVLQRLLDKVIAGATSHLAGDLRAAGGASIN
jgi:hypothetical protein